MDQLLHLLALLRQRACLHTSTSHVLVALVKDPVRTFVRAQSSALTCSSSCADERSVFPNADSVVRAVSLAVGATLSRTSAQLVEESEPRDELHRDLGASAWRIPPPRPTGCLLGENLVRGALRLPGRSVCLYASCERHRQRRWWLGERRLRAQLDASQPRPPEPWLSLPLAPPPAALRCCRTCCQPARARRC